MFRKKDVKKDTPFSDLVPLKSTHYYESWSNKIFVSDDDNQNIIISTIIATNSLLAIGAIIIAIIVAKVGIK